MDIKKISERFSDGKPLTDKELDFFIDYMERLFVMLKQLGREYHIVRKHIATELHGAKSNKFHREHC